MADNISPEATDTDMKSVEALASALFRAWSIETSSLWTPDNPARGQCGVTGLVVQDLCGGEILKTRTPEGMHFYNRVNGGRIDLTQAQFADLPRYEDLPATRAEAFADTALSQYRALRRNPGISADGTDESA